MTRPLARPGRLDALGHHNNFNLLRFLFASLVIVSHAPELQDGNRSHEILTQLFGTISFGEMAVDSFFILSGYLIVKSWKDRPQALPFLASRILRIYPGFVVAALLATLALVPLFSQSKSIGGVDFLALLKGLTKLSLVGVPDVFIHTHYPTLNGAMWTIPYEFKCYMLVLACGLLGLLSHRAAWLAITLAASAVHLAGQLDWAPAALGLYSRFLMAFGAGGCFYLYRDTIPWRLDMAWLALLTFIGALSFKHLAEPALCIFWGYAVVFYALKGRALLAFNQLPDISYGIYLYAWPINKVVLWYAPTMNVYLLMACVLALSIVAGTISWYLVEKPFIRLKKYLPAGPAKDGRHLASS